jgi:hypothetical protein
MHQWRYLKMMKKSGGSYEDNGIDRMSPGQLVVACPVCPAPGINLPDGWDAPDVAKP